MYSWIKKNHKYYPWNEFHPKPEPICNFSVMQPVMHSAWIVTRNSKVPSCLFSQIAKGIREKYANIMISLVYQLLFVRQLFQSQKKWQTSHWITLRFPKWYDMPNYPYRIALQFYVNRVCSMFTVHISWVTRKNISTSQQQGKWIVTVTRDESDEFVQNPLELKMIFWVAI